MCTTARTVYPGFRSRSAAHAVRARSMTRLRLGAPPAANSRDKCSRVTRSAAATWPVCVGKATRRSTSSQAASCRRSVRRSSLGASASASRRATCAVRAVIHSPATALSTPSTSTPANPAASPAASRGPSSGRTARKTNNGVRGGVPREVGDALLLLRDALAALRLEQEEVAELVDRLAAEAEVPVDDANGAVPHQVLEPGLLGHFAARGVGGGLAGFEVALGGPPVAVGVAGQEEPRLAAPSAPEYEPPPRGLALGPPPASWARLGKP